MVHAGFYKIAVTTVNLTPEEYFDLARSKDPYATALGGAAAGAAVGALKAKKNRAAGALVGAGVGATTGAAVGHAASKALRRYQAHKVRQYTEELKLRAMPPRSGVSRGHGE